ncbi:MAG: OmpH family outer membrane protein [Saprospiraceae bacterium]
MKKITKICFLVLATLMLSQTSTFAQKFGHLNSMSILQALPGRAAADKELETFQDKLNADYQVKIEAFKKEYEALLKRVEAGELSEMQKQAEGAALQQKEQDLLKEEQALIKKVQQKRETLLKPLLDKVSKAINEIGKENGYTFIFDTSTMNLMLFAEESSDVTAMVKSKLGL